MILDFSKVHFLDALLELLQVLQRQSNVLGLLLFP
jgi:hypothetical protein